jgi:hypothetical protein
MIILSSGRGYCKSAPAGGSSPTYTPIVAEDFSGGSLSATYSPTSWKSGASIYDDTYAKTGSQSLKITAAAGEPYPTCGGDTYFGGYQAFAIPIPIGNTVWYRAYLYFPSTFSWGYVFQSGTDSTEGSNCGFGGADGNGPLKFMRLSPTTGTSRIYLQPYCQRRNVAQPSGNITRIISETGPTFADLDNADGKVLIGEWVALQIAVKVASDSSGFIRYWLNDNYIGEATGPTVSSGNSLAHWGFGTYWNGVHYTDGSAGREDFWVDEVICATDIEGYGAPNTLDSGGRPYITSTTYVGDFA